MPVHLIGQKRTCAHGCCKHGLMPHVVLCTYYWPTFRIHAPFVRKADVSWSMLPCCVNENTTVNCCQTWRIFGEWEFTAVTTRHTCLTQNHQGLLIYHSSTEWSGEDTTNAVSLGQWPRGNSHGPFPSDLVFIINHDLSRPSADHVT